MNGPTRTDATKTSVTNTARRRDDVPHDVPPHSREDFFRDLKEGEADPQWEHFRDTLKKLAQVPKEELNEKLAENKKKRAG